MQKNCCPTGMKGGLARKNYNLASEKGNVGWEKMARSPMVLGPRPKMDPANRVCVLQSYHFCTKTVSLSSR